MSIFGFRKTRMVGAEEALPGRDTPMPVPELHAVLGKQYLYKVPNGYCPDHSTGVSCPVGLIKAD